MHKTLASSFLLVFAASHVQALSTLTDGVLLYGRQASLDVTNETQTPYNTTIGTVNGLNFEVANQQVIAQDLSIEPPQRPAAFTLLWDYLDEELCTGQGCTASVEYCVVASADGQQVCISAQGDYSQDRRAELIDAARGLFDRRVRYVESDSGVTETGPGWVAVQLPTGNDFLQVSLQNRRKGDEDSGTNERYVYAGAASSWCRAGGLFWVVVGLLCSSVGPEVVNR